jgi:hypothetical protein
MKIYSFSVALEPDEDASGGPAWHAYCPALVISALQPQGVAKMKR